MSSKTHKEYSIEKIINLKLTKNLFIVFVVLFLIASFFILDTRRRLEVSELDTYISQVTSQYKLSEKNISDATKLFESDYTNRAYAVDYILSNYNKPITIEELNRVKNLMYVDYIFLVDKNGYITHSTDQGYVGKNELEIERCKPFWPLIKGTSQQTYAIQYNGKSILYDTPNVYISVKSNIPNVSVVQIAVPYSTYENFINPYKIENVIRHIPTIFEQAIFAVDATTGEILSITENNVQYIFFDEDDTDLEFLEKLKNNQSKYTNHMNNTRMHLQTVQMDNYIFGACVNTSYVYSQALKEIIILALMLLMIMLCTYLMIKNIIKHYIIKDIIIIDENLKKFMSGHTDVKFDLGFCKEVNNLSHMLNEWMSSYNLKSVKMTQLISKIDNKIASFECLPVIQRVFYSENLVNFLGISKEEMEKLSNNPLKFEEYIKTLTQNKNENDIIQIGQHFINIKYFNKGNEFYGVVFDKTNDITQIEELEEKLTKAKSDSFKDPLTNLANRRYMEEYITDILKLKEYGTMMIFDLDNFKLVNDNEGHQAGDRLLMEFADCLRISFSKEDLIARMGGDEFVVFIKEQLSNEAISIKCEKALKIIRNRLYAYGRNYNISASIGVSKSSSKVSTFEKLYKNTDVALYIAKGNGKNTYYINDKNIECKNGGNCKVCTKQCELYDKLKES